MHLAMPVLVTWLMGFKVMVSQNEVDGTDPESCQKGL